MKIVRAKDPRKKPLQWGNTARAECGLYRWGRSAKPPFCLRRWGSITAGQSRTVNCPATIVQIGSPRSSTCRESRGYWRSFQQIRALSTWPYRDFRTADRVSRFTTSLHAFGRTRHAVQAAAQQPMTSVEVSHTGVAPQRNHDQIERKYKSLRAASASEYQLRFAVGTHALEILGVIVVTP